MSAIKTLPILMLSLIAGTSIAPKLQEAYKVRHQTIKENLTPNTNRDTGKFVLASTMNPETTPPPYPPECVIVFYFIILPLMAFLYVFIYEPYRYHGHFGHLSYRKDPSCEACKKDLEKPPEKAPVKPIDYVPFL